MPSQYLVVRSLDASTDEEALTQGISKLFVEKPSQNKDNGPRPATKLKSTAPTGDTSGLGAKPGTLRRVFLMRDRRTNESWKYGFAEFATLEDAQGAMAKFRALKSFTIGSKAVVVGLSTPASSFLPWTLSLQKRHTRFSLPFTIRTSS